MPVIIALIEPPCDSYGELLTQQDAQLHREHCCKTHDDDECYFDDVDPDSPVDGFGIPFGRS